MARLRETDVLFAGTEDVLVNSVSQTWTWDGTSWTFHEVEGPPARIGALMARLGDRVVLFGGMSDQGPLTDMWAWDDRSWTELLIQSPATVSAFGGPGVMAPLGTNLLLLFEPFSGETWTFDGTTWTNTNAPPPFVPSYQGGPGGVVSSAWAGMASFGEGVVLFTLLSQPEYVIAPNEPDTPFSVTWTWSGSEWTAVDISSTPLFGMAGALMATPGQ
jgi:hypothetical protein